MGKTYFLVLFRHVGEKKIFQGETRVNIIFNKNFVLNKYPLTFMPLTQKKLFAFLM